MPVEAQTTDKKPVVPEGRFYFDGRRSFARIEQIAEAITAPIEQIRGKIAGVGESLLRLAVKNEDGDELVLYGIKEIRNLLKNEVEICRRMDEDGFVNEEGKLSTSIWNFYQAEREETRAMVSITIFGKHLSITGIPFKFAIDRRGRDNTKVYDVDEMAEVLRMLLEKRQLQKKIRATKGLYKHPELGFCGAKDTLANYFEVSEHAFKPRVDWGTIPSTPGITAHGRHETLYQVAAVKKCLKDIFEAKNSIVHGECHIDGTNFITAVRFTEKHTLGINPMAALDRLQKHLAQVQGAMTEGIDRKSGDKLIIMNEELALEIFEIRLSVKTKRTKGRDEFMDARKGRCVLLKKFLSEHREFPRVARTKFYEAVADGSLNLRPLIRINSLNQVCKFYPEKDLIAAFDKFSGTARRSKIAAASVLAWPATPAGTMP